MGRPATYTDEFIEKLADELIEWFEADETRFFLKKFCVEKRLHAQRISEFATKNEKFREALKLAKDMQEVRLVELGMLTKSPMPIFALKNVAGWRDNKDVNFGVNQSDLEAVMAAYSKAVMENPGQGVVAQRDTEGETEPSQI